MGSVIVPNRDIRVPRFRYDPDDYARYERLIRRRQRQPRWSPYSPYERHAAIAFDAFSDGNVVNSTTIGWNHTFTGSNGIIIVGFSGDSVGGADDISAVTIGGSAATLAAKKTNAAGGDRMMYMYFRLGISAGVNAISITASSSHNLSGGAVSYTGVAQSGQPDNTTTNVEANPASLTLTTSLTTVADNCLMVLLEGCFDASPPAAGTGSTRRGYDQASANGAWGLFDNNAAIHPAGANSMTTNRTSNPFGLTITHVAMSIAPFVAAGGGPFPHFTRRLHTGGMIALG